MSVFSVALAELLSPSTVKCHFSCWDGSLDQAEQRDNLKERGIILTIHTGQPRPRPGLIPSICHQIHTRHASYTSRLLWEDRALEIGHKRSITRWQSSSEGPIWIWDPNPHVPSTASLMLSHTVWHTRWQTNSVRLNDRLAVCKSRPNREAWNEDQYEIRTQRLTEFFQSS